MRKHPLTRTASNTQHGWGAAATRRSPERQLGQDTSPSPAARVPSCRRRAPAPSRSTGGAGPGALSLPGRGASLGWLSQPGCLERTSDRGTPELTGVRSAPWPLPQWRRLRPRPPPRPRTPASRLSSSLSSLVRLPLRPLGIARVWNRLLTSRLFAHVLCCRFRALHARVSELACARRCQHLYCAWRLSDARSAADATQRYDYHHCCCIARPAALRVPPGKS